jgi:PucR C-terminal helix-turn-helix domain
VILKGESVGQIAAAVEGVMMAHLRVSGRDVDSPPGSCHQGGTTPSSLSAIDVDLGSHGLAVDLLVGALLGEHAQLVRRVREAMQGELLVYRSIPGEALDVDVERQLGLVLRAVAGGRAALTDEAQCQLAAVGERRARQGVPVDDMLRAWRIGVEIVVGYAREVGQRLCIDDAQVLEFVQSALAWSDAAMVTTTRAHRRADLAVTRAADEHRADFVRGVLLGTVPNAELRIQAEMYGLDPAGEYVAVRARFDQAASQDQLKRALRLDDSAQDRRGMCAVVNGDFAGFLSEAPPSRMEGIVGFGPPRPLDRLAESYRSAARALVTAEACGLRGAFSIASLGLRPALALDTEVGELVRRRYLQPLAAGNSASELIATLRAYLGCGMHVERTATQLFVHQNTVRYRIARFEELTGASLADTEVLLEVWWALELSAMTL